jgi:hypothetical protein
MYLTAQHVVSPTTRSEGVNSFLYRHGLVWDAAPPTDIPEQNPGSLVAQSISVPPPGNRIRSYLDIVAPDDARWNEVRVGLMDFVGRAQPNPLPWRGQSGRCTFALGMDSELSSQWIGELAVLYRSAQALRLATAG